MAQAKSSLRQYPSPVTRRSGIKVGWYYYATETEAKKASAVARHNADILSDRGYDFGYQSPGRIRPPGRAGTEYGDLWEVCTP